MIGRVPGALMIVPLLLGAVINTVDQMHLPPVQRALQAIGAPPVVDASTATPLLDPQTNEPIRNPYTGQVVIDPRTATPRYELLNLGGFTTALVRGGALTLIALFLFCVGSQMSFKVGGRALKKGVAITLAKFAAAVSLGYLISGLTDEFAGFLGLSTVAIIAAMSNGNGGLYVSLTGEYGNRSDVGAVSIISLNDGPFLTLLALGMLGESFPIAAFLAVLLPMLIGFGIGHWDPRYREFLKPGERLTIPFFAFALGTTMSFATFANTEVLSGGLFLGFATVLVTGAAAAVVLRVIGERSQVAAFAEASTAGNAIQTPLAVAAAAAIAAQSGQMPADRAIHYQSIVATATAQISIATLTTALLCPLAVILWSRHQGRRGIEGRVEELALGSAGAPLRPTAAGEVQTGSSSAAPGGGADRS